jgi:hypothetical protein
MPWARVGRSAPGRRPRSSSRGELPAPAGRAHPVAALAGHRRGLPRHQPPAAHRTGRPLRGGGGRQVGAGAGRTHLLQLPGVEPPRRRPSGRLHLGQRCSWVGRPPRRQRRVHSPAHLSPCRAIQAAAHLPLLPRLLRSTLRPLYLSTQHSDAHPLPGSLLRGAPRTPYDPPVQTADAPRRARAGSLAHRAPRGQAAGGRGRLAGRRVDGG